MDYNTGVAKNKKVCTLEKSYILQKIQTNHDSLYNLAKIKPFLCTKL